MADRVRYYLEQLAPELEDLEKKGLFDKNELAIIMRKRTAFEHRITGRTSKPKDFIKYAEYEMNVDDLKKKRVHRLGVKDTRGPSEGAGPRRINFIFDRGVRKYPSDMQMWTHYLQYSKKKGQVNIINKIFTRMLGLHPMKPNIWLMAAKYEADDQSSMRAARSLFQRGLRFNTNSHKLWYEYAKLELLYVSKLLARRKLMGIQNKIEQEDKGLDIEMPELTSKDLLNEGMKNLPEADFAKLGNLEENAALKGDIALAIFDEAVTRVVDPMKFAIDFIELVDSFKDLDRQYLCLHIINWLNTHHKSERTRILEITLPIRHTLPTSRKFPDLLKLVINNYNKEKEKSVALKQLFRERVIQEYVNVEGLDSNIKKALEILDSKI